MDWVLLGVVFGTTFSAHIVCEWISERARLSQAQGHFVLVVLNVLNALLLISIFAPLGPNGTHLLTENSRPFILYGSVLGFAASSALYRKRFQAGADDFKRRDEQQKQAHRRYRSDGNH